VRYLKTSFDPPSQDGDAAFGQTLTLRAFDPGRPESGAAVLVSSLSHPTEAAIVPSNSPSS